MAGQQIMCFKKSVADLTNPNVSATASQGSDVAEFPLNRNNLSAWITSGSVDADNTTWEVDFVDYRLITDILLVKHNFKSYTIQYWDGSAYQNFSPAISATGVTAATSRHSFTEVAARKIKITITGTQVVNSDKVLYQFIATKLLGQFTGWPIIKNPRISPNRKIDQMLSGRASVIENVRAFSAELEVKNWRVAADLTIVENLHLRTEPFLIWLCGGDETQFFSKRYGYRLEDIFLVKVVNDYEPEYVDGLYQAGLQIRMKVQEVTE